MGFDNVNVNVSGPMQPTSTYKTKVLKGNHSFASQVTEPNMKYVIKYDFDLGGESVTIPANCILGFDGSSVVNGGLVGQHTKLVANTNHIFDNISISGTWNTEYVSSLMFKQYDEEALINCIALANGDCKTYISVEKDDIDVHGFLDGSSDSSDHSNFLAIPSNTIIDFCGGTLNVLPNDRQYVRALMCYNVDNVVIKNVSIIGDVETHTEDTEWCFGIAVIGSRNIIIENCSLEKHTGDGIYIAAIADTTNSIYVMDKDIVVDNCRCLNNRRQGISVINGYNVIIRNSYFEGIGSINGTSPMAGIDIEPNKVQQLVDTFGYEVKEILIDNCLFVNNTGRDIHMSNGIGSIHDVVIQNVRTVFNLSTDTRECSVDLRSINTTLKNSSINGIVHIQGYQTNGRGLITDCVINGYIDLYSSVGEEFLITNSIIDASSYEKCFVTNRFQDMSRLNVANNQIIFKTQFIFVDSQADRISQHLGGMSFNNNIIKDVTPDGSGSNFVVIGNFIGNTINGLRAYININLGSNANHNLLDFKGNNITTTGNPRVYVAHGQTSQPTLNFEDNQFIADGVTDNQIFYPTITALVKVARNLFNGIFTTPSFASNASQSWKDNATEEIMPGITKYDSNTVRGYMRMGTVMRDLDGFHEAKKKGATADRPVGINAGGKLESSDKGYQFFDETLGRWIFVNSVTYSSGYVIWREMRDGAAAGIRRTGTYGQVPNTPSDVYEGFMYMIDNGTSHFPIYAHLNGNTIEWYKADGTQYTGQ